MKKGLSVGLLVAGLLLLYFGYQEYHSFGSEVDRALGGGGSSEAIWMLAGGAAAALAGLFGLFRGRK